MVLNNDKRIEVLLVECYRGLKLFQPFARQHADHNENPQVTSPEPFTPVQHAQGNSNGVRELVLK